MSAKFYRLSELHRPNLTIWWDNQPIAALQGDTLLTAILTHGGSLRETEFDHQPRAGFCLIGACNDCMVWTSDGAKIQACSTPVTENLHVFTHLPREAEWPPLIS